MLYLKQNDLTSENWENSEAATAENSAVQETSSSIQTVRLYVFTQLLPQATQL